MGQQTKIVPVGNPADITNTNPMTGNFYNNLLSMYAQNQNNLTGLTTNNNLTQLTNVSPELQQLATALTGGYVQSGQQAANLASANAAQQVANQFSNSNALNSGPALAAMMKGAMEPQAQLVQNIAGMQSGIMQNLAGQYLAGKQNEYQTQATLGQQMLGLAGQYAAPEWWQPTYNVQQQQGIFGSLLQGALGGAGAGAAFGPAGAGIGAGIGGGLGLLSGLFG